jgi:hypothetical protein
VTRQLAEKHLTLSYLLSYFDFENRHSDYRNNQKVNVKTNPKILGVIVPVSFSYNKLHLFKIYIRL